MLKICKETAKNAVFHAKATDFINYVFSYDHRPHDFKTLVPKGFADGVYNPNLTHYAVTDDGEIKALVDLFRSEISVGKEKLSVGLIGNVSVHPYSRKCGYMQKLMAEVLSDAEKDGCDFLALGGQRQRYGYFGFEKAGIGIRFDLNTANIRHALGEVDASPFSLCPLNEADSDALDLAFRLNEAKSVHASRPRSEMLDILHTWGENADVIRKDGVPCGILVGKIHEISLADEGDFPAVLKAVYTHLGIDRISVTVPTWEKERIAFLSSVAENETIVTCEQIKILNYKKTVGAFLALQAKIKPLCDTGMHIAVKNSHLNIAVNGGIPTVSDEEIPGECYTGMGETQAVSYFFGLNGLLGTDAEAGNLFPLPFFLSPTDLF